MKKQVLITGINSGIILFMALRYEEPRKVQVSGTLILRQIREVNSLTQS